MYRSAARPAGGSGEGDIFLKQEPGEEGDGEGDEQRRDVGTDGHKTQRHKLFLQNVVVDNEIEQPVETYIGSATYPVTEELAAEIAAEGWIEDVDYLADEFSCTH